MLLRQRRNKTPSTAPCQMSPRLSVFLCIFVYIISVILFTYLVV